MQMIQSALDYERSEFSRLLDSRKKEIEEKNETVSRMKVLSKLSGHALWLQT
jgi:hypothetical protein